MTLGEKMKQARKNCGLSQQQLADRLLVSRSAVAKWETDKGLPDVGNLKTLARLLNVSVDHLLDETETAETPVIREIYSLAACGQGCKKVKKDRLVRRKFPDSRIYTLFAQQERTGSEARGVLAQDCCTGSKQTEDKAFYLVEKEGLRQLVAVSDTFLEIRRLDCEMQCDDFQMDGWHFIRSNYELLE